MRGCRGRMARATMAVAAALGVAACYVTTDLSGLSGGGSGALDGSMVGPEGAADAPVAADAGADAADARDAGGDAPFVCTGASFCDDFERVAVLGAWDQIVVGAAGTLALTAHAKEGKSALRSTMTAQANSSAGLLKKLGQAKALHLTYSMFLSDSPVRDIHLVPIELDYAEEAGQRRMGLFLFLNAGTVAFVEQEFVGITQTFFRSTTPVAAVLNQWVDVDIQLDLSSTPATIVVSYGGNELQSGALARQYPPAAPAIVMGSSYSTMGTATSIDFDNVFAKITAP